MHREIYLDNNATTQPLPEVCKEVLRVLESRAGNPSSDHAAGKRAREIVEVARNAVARLIGAVESRVVFTSGATEANNMVIASAIRRTRNARIVTTAVEHSSILGACEHFARAGGEIVLVPVQSNGQIELDALERALNAPTALVSVQWANSETGVIQPIENIGQICQRRGVLFHSDAAQAVGKLLIDISDIPVDLLSFSAHKFHGPAGAGSVYIRETALVEPLLYGGPQENRVRAGTENVLGIAGFGVAAAIRQLRFTDVETHLGALRDRFEHLIRKSVPDVVINGGDAARLYNTTNLRFIGVDGQALVARLDQLNIRCSQSSACTNQRPEPSYVLRAMGLSEQDAYSSVRFSFGVDNTAEEIDIATEIIREICQQLRNFSSRIHNPYQLART